jgi:hypothetical protein
MQPPRYQDAITAAESQRIERLEAMYRGEYSPCPRCGGVVGEVDGWVDYGDRTIEFIALGCWECGWHEELEVEQPDEDRKSVPAGVAAPAGPVCADCQGDGRCTLCGGAGELIGEDDVFYQCLECGGSGECSNCAALIFRHC